MPSMLFSIFFWEPLAKLTSRETSTPSTLAKTSPVLGLEKVPRTCHTAGLELGPARADKKSFKELRKGFRPDSAKGKNDKRRSGFLRRDMLHEKGGIAEI